MIATRLLHRNQAELTKLFRQFAETAEPALTRKHVAPSAMEFDEYHAIQEQIIRFQAPLAESEIRLEQPPAMLIPWPPI